MRRILIFDEANQPEKQRQLLALLTVPDRLPSVAGDLADFEKLLKERAHELVVLLLADEPSDALADVLTKCRNQSALRDVPFVALHRRVSAAGIQKSLMLGIREIFAEPVSLLRISRRIHDLLEGTRSDTAIAPFFHDVPPIPAELHAFGRIGKLQLQPLGDLHVETDARLPRGQAVGVLSRLARDLGLRKFNYTVASSSALDTYYHYRHGYQLSWHSDPALKRRLASWLRRDRSIFALPKTKVLWLTLAPLGGLEAGFEKKIFSLHALAPGRVTYAALNRLNPRILIADELGEGARKAVREWLADRTSREERLVFSTAPENPDGWAVLPTAPREAFQAAFLAQARPFLAERVSATARQARYFSRRSHYSRLVMPFEARVLRVSRTQLVVDSPVDLEPGAIFQLHCLELEDPAGTGLYLKSLHADRLPEEHGRWRLTAELVPLSDHANPALEAYVEALERRERAGAREEFAAPARPPVRARTLEPFFMKVEPAFFEVSRVFTALLLLGVVFAAALTWLHPPVIHGVQPAGLTEVFQAIRQAFR